jgi:hypothetical protein
LFFVQNTAEKQYGVLKKFYAVRLMLLKQRKQFPVQFIAVPVFVGHIGAAGIKNAEIADKFP